MSKKFKLIFIYLFLLFSSYTTIANANTEIRVNTDKFSKDIATSEVHRYNFIIKNNWTYVVYLGIPEKTGNTNNTGDADLYERYLNVPLNSNYALSSVKGGQTDDFFRFKSNKSGVYEVSVLGYRAGPYNIHVIGFPTNAPNSLKGKLVHPLENNPDYTYDEQGGDYGRFGSPWGGPTKEWLGAKNQHHTAVDWKASHNTVVSAAHSGTVTLGNAGYDVSTGLPWGYFVRIDGTIGGKAISTIYMHLQNSGRPTNGSVKAGDPIGKIYDVSDVPGEKSHLHFTIFWGGGYSHLGSLPYNQFPGSFISPEDSSLYRTTLAPGSLKPRDSCGNNKVYDCSYRCVDKTKALRWIGDNFCDNAQSSYNINLMCSAFNNDNGDCN